MSFTFATLKTAIQDYSENTETTFTNNLSNFIKIAEERILKNVQLSIFRKNATAAFTSSSEFLACPTDFLTPFSLSFTDASSNKVFLDYKDVNAEIVSLPRADVPATPVAFTLTFVVDDSSSDEAITPVTVTVPTEPVASKFDVNNLPIIPSPTFV